MENENQFYATTLKHVFEIFIEPDVQRRRAEGTITTLAFAIQKAQVIFPGDGSRHTVRLNDEVRAGAIAELLVSKEVGEAVTAKDINIKKIILTDAEDQNSGYFTLI